MQQQDYGGMWPSGDTWWEYQCEYEWVPCRLVCNADWGGSLYWRDHFVYDGTGAALVGEVFVDTYWDSMITGTFCTYWWDVAAASWYVVDQPGCNDIPVARMTIACTELQCEFDARDSSDVDGQIQYSQWHFGDGATAVGATASHSYASPGAYEVRLEVVDDGGAWGEATSTLEVAGSPALPTPPPPPPNQPPSPALRVSCTGLACSFDASESADPDGSVTGYEWTFGDGGSAVGRPMQPHVYDSPGTYAIWLRVQDNREAMADLVESIALVDVTARAARVKGLWTVELAWHGVTGPADLFRDGARIATVSSGSYIDTAKLARGSHGYQVCAAGTEICSAVVFVAI